MFYTIKPGDTIYAIASEYKTTVSEILASNPGLAPYNLIVGQQIIIPVPSQSPDRAGISINEMKLRNILRSLWEQHVAWTRMTILSAAAGSPDLRFTVDRLLRNPADMANALDLCTETRRPTPSAARPRAPVYRASACECGESRQYTGSPGRRRALVSNADQIAAYLNTINPYIDR